MGKRGGGRRESRGSLSSFFLFCPPTSFFIFLGKKKVTNHFLKKISSFLYLHFKYKLISLIPPKKPKNIKPSLIPRTLPMGDPRPEGASESKGIGGGGGGGRGENGGMMLLPPPPPHDPRFPRKRKKRMVEGNLKGVITTSEEDILRVWPLPLSLSRGKGDFLVFLLRTFLYPIYIWFVSLGRFGDLSSHGRKGDLCNFLWALV